MRKLDLIEYKWNDGQWSFKDSEMLWCYDHLTHRQDTFYNARDEWRDSPRWNPILYWRGCKTYIGFVEGTPTGMLWLSAYNVPNKSGFLNFTYFDLGNVDMYEKIGLALNGIRQTFGLANVDTMYAETSVCRVAAITMAKYIGFKELGIIPSAHYHIDEDKFYDTVFMYLKLDMLR